MSARLHNGQEGQENSEFKSFACASGYLFQRTVTAGAEALDDMARIFVDWPAAIPRQGTVLTKFGESIPFNDYLLTSELVLLIRPQPDAHGTRRMIVRLADIAAIRIMEAIEPERFMAMGFQRHATLGV